MVVYIEACVESQFTGDCGLRVEHYHTYLMIFTVLLLNTLHSVVAKGYLSVPGHSVGE